MRTSLLLVAGVCLLTPGLSQAQSTAKPANPPATTAKPQAGPNADKKEVKVSPKVLQTYVGDYEMAPGRVLKITLDKGYLWGQPTDQEARQLYPASQTQFFLKDLPVVLTFKTEKGKVTGALMQQEGRPDRDMTKVK